MAGYFQLPQRVNADGRPYPGAKAYFYEAATLTPLAVYRDYSLGSEHPNPLTADADGVFDPVFLDEADGFFRYRLTTSAGVVLQDITTLPIVGPAGGEGGGGEVAVDPDALFKTADTKWRLGTGTHSGFVRVNGRTIGSASSGASERANADTQALFEHVWGEFSNDLCPVSGGRGASAAADFAANKTITLPDARGRAIAGLDDMGNSAAGRLTSATISGGATTLGHSGGAQTVSLVKANLPADPLTFTTASGGSHNHSFTYSRHANENDNNDQYVTNISTSGEANSVNTSTGGAHTHTGSTENMGSGTALNKMPPVILATLYVKL